MEILLWNTIGNKKILQMEIYIRFIQENKFINKNNRRIMEEFVH